ncbi:MAG: tRNA (N(6)-L-threonylcarbamoyladenosine(37)-C(2))-methylthiotransferase MtaB [Tenericutes bacterium]|nr:tRNA (N(6)-L-threonylcarbamoyladenosine(37)-C(2))-methylthiotransferase MtaB [Mycoplasmatota bacterium]
MKFCIKTLGCKVNTYESELIHGLFVRKGYVYDEDNADIYVVNTCTVTNMSDRKSRQIIHGIRNNHKDSIIVVCGCYSQNAYNTGKLDDIDADIILGNKDKSKIVEYVEDYLKNKVAKKVFYDIMDVPFENMELVNTFDRTRAFVKIEDGCENYCTYCIIPYVRGKVRSKDHNLVIEEVTNLVNNGYKEIVLTGIHTGHYVDGNYNFASLLRDLINIKGLIRLRISSIEINELTDEVLDIFKNSSILVPHLHVPLQSGSDRILKEMNRKYDKKYFIDRINYIRSIKPDVSITTDVIVGFPTESKEEHIESMDTIRKIGFAKVHTFPYSDRYGTPASKMSGKIDGNIKKRRVKEIIELSSELERMFYEKFYNRQLDVLFEEEKDGYFIGHTANFIKVKVKGNYKINEIFSVLLSSDNIII